MSIPRTFSALLFLGALCRAGIASAQIHASVSSFDSTELRGKIETELEYLAPTYPSRDISLTPKIANHLRDVQRGLDYVWNKTVGFRVFRSEL